MTSKIILRLQKISYSDYNKEMTKYLPKFSMSMIVDPLYGGIVAGVLTFVVKFLDDKLVGGNPFYITNYLKASLYAGSLVGLFLYLAQNPRLVGASGRSMYGGGERFLQGLGENMLSNGF